MGLSKRLQGVADFVTPSLKIADVGTDHGYIPIYLVGEKNHPFAIAMDVNKGPLSKAKEHIQKANMEDKIETRLSNGLMNLGSDEVESIVISGMGGRLIIQILEEGSELLNKKIEYILQPQSDWRMLREFLQQSSFEIIEENMIFEEQKFYLILKVRKGGLSSYEEIELRFGKILLEKSHPVLKEYLKVALKKQEHILNGLKEDKEHIRAKREALLLDIRYTKEALQKNKLIREEDVYDWTQII